MLIKLPDRIFEKTVAQTSKAKTLMQSQTLYSVSSHIDDLKHCPTTFSLLNFSAAIFDLNRISLSFSAKT